MDPRPQLTPATLKRRALAAIFDAIIVFLALFWAIWMWGTPNDDGGKTLTGIPALLLMLGAAAFWIIPEWLLGTTMGKWACDLQVTTLRGGSISLAQALQRNVLRPLDFFPFYLTGFITASLTPNRQRLGDLWAKTIVVSEKATKQDVAQSTP